MSRFEKVLDEYKEQTKPMCEALDCLDLLDDFLVDIELSRAKYHHFYQAGQQSQQAKIDELNEVVNWWKDEYRIMTLRYERSKGRIDEALSHLDLAYPESWGCCVEQAMDILKGNKDETII